MSNLKYLAIPTGDVVSDMLLYHMMQSQMCSFNGDAVSNTFI